MKFAMLFRGFVKKKCLSKSVVVEIVPNTLENNNLMKLTPNTNEPATRKVKVFFDCRLRVR